RELAKGTFSLTVIPLGELQRQIQEKTTTGPALAAERVRWRLHRAGWNEPPHKVQVGSAIRLSSRRRRIVADYVLHHGECGPIAVVEVKPSYLPADAGLAQAKRAASVLGVRFAYATNGVQVVEYDLVTGTTAWRLDFPTPQELWQRLRVSATNQTNRQVDG
ncbi:MAG: type I restriction enzyme HsdR N-terminal domain-containing protein, partial [Acidobacteriota bacterium]|nr:type I restriction enzyme HsdR N-terminal domain-containing protein [Acidobacteriota bacterium]